MFLKFNRRKIETICIIISIVLIIIMTILGILAIADELFNWDIFPENIETIIILFLSSFGLIIFACFLLVVMINFSIISLSLEKISDTYVKNKKIDKNK